MNSCFTKYYLLLVRTVLVFTGFLCIHSRALAVEEPYMNELKGAQVAVNNFFTVADEKFNTTAAALIQQQISVNNIVSFEINFDTSIYFYDKPFECTVNFKIYIYNNINDTSQVTDSTTHSNIALQVRYDTVTGKPYKGIALYKFANARKYKIKILSITSPQLNPIPAIFRLKGQIIIDRKYIFQDNSADITRYSILNGNQLKLEWSPSNYPGAEQFDLEYTHVDGASQIAASIRNYQSGTGYTVPVDSLSLWFANNNSRITTASSAYLMNIPYDSGFILFRIRGVQIHYPDEVRWEGNWNYFARRSTDPACTTCPAGVVFFNPHESNINWQYTVSFAEEGKRKEVISYFDGTLRSRQSVTINNSDNRNIVQETIYDALGRSAVKILPAPTKDSTIHYFRSFNRNIVGDPYSFSDLLYDCRTHAAPVSSMSGAGKYYSSENEFINTSHYAKYIPSAEGYPFSVTEYMADNTGRVKVQGGVGPKFQLDSNHSIRFYYAKPGQTDLDRLFGSEAGNANHYKKTMMVDQNGQINISYINAGGKTVASALAGSAPANLHALPSTTGASTMITHEMMQPEDFYRNPSDYSVAASATFLAPVTGTYVLNYRVDPLRMEKLYGPNKDSVICNNCYYDLVITVKDDCNTVIREETRSAGTVFDTACSNPPAPVQGTINVVIPAIGEYYVTYRLVISRAALDFYDDTHLVKNSDIKKLNYFLLEELKQTDFFGCYSQCETCLDALGDKAGFTQRFKTFYTADSLSFSVTDSLFVLSLYDSLYQHCMSIQGACAGNVCDEKLELLKMDAHPGGQYAPYDTTNNSLLEPEINVLAQRHQIVQFTDAFGNRDYVQLYKENGEDSIRIDVKDLNDSMFIAHWRDEWADSLVRLHPEYCHYLWCVANSNSFAFDRQVEDLISGDTAIGRGWFNPGTYDAIVNFDPFFLPGGNGFGLQGKMRDDLRMFSRNFARISQPDRNILQFIDITLYCKAQANGWDACNPENACRSRSREWFLYQQLYLNLKQKYYEEARRNSSDPVFANCVNCYIGNDLVQGATCAPPVSDFVVEEYRHDGIDSVVVKYIGDPAGVGKRLIVQASLECFHDFARPGPNREYLPEQPEPIVFMPGESIKYTLIQDPDITDPFGNCIVVIDKVLCDDDTTQFQPPTTCNYNCPGGIYDPYDKANVSYYVEYGSAQGFPAGVPGGYGTWQFYSVFDLATGAGTSCKFFNVWVAVYDSTCFGVCYTPVIPSKCPEDPNAELYKNKVRRYPEYVNADEFINSTLSGNPQQSSEYYDNAAIAECHRNCEAQADIWINQLSRCTTDQNMLSQLKQALIEICSKGCSVNSSFGTSTLPDTVTATYHSFEEAIIAIIGPGAINDTCTAELLANPYPYNRQPVYAERIIHETNYDICQKIGQYRSAWQSSGSGLTFHDYLTQTLGKAYDLDVEELDDLLNSCINCNGILKDDIVLPAAFEPGSAPCLLCDSVQPALAAFNAKFPGISTSSDQYEGLFANFFNHRFGYALTYDQYRSYLDSCTTHPGYAASLCNKPMVTEATIDNNGDGCMADLFATALTNANNTYIAYIDSVRRDFREAYMTRCMNVQPALKMSAELFEYHYTLYYYDQSGNLVKTIPPEGVALLNNDSIELVKLHRKLQNEGCYQYSDSIHFNNNGQINWTLSDTFEARNYTAEMMLNLDAHANQVLVSKLTEYTYDTSGGVNQFYRHAGFLIKVEGNKLRAEVYGIDADTLQTQALAISVLDAPSIIPLHTWTHYVVQRSHDPLAPIRLWVNGNPVALQYTITDLDSSIILGGNVNLVVGTHNAPHLPAPGKLQGTIKNLRIYNRLLFPSEIRQNTYNNCQLPINRTGLLFWSAMNNAKDNQVKDLISQQNGVLTGFTWQPFNGVFPVHTLPTFYIYNSLNNVLFQYSPDSDTMQLFYDRVGRLTASQNKEQRDNASYSGGSNRFSYTRYDALGRIVEVGEKSNSNPDIRNIDLLDSLQLKNWLASGVSRQTVKTLYDDPVNLPLQQTSTSRMRVVASVYLENANDAEGDSTLYNYDILGNVKTVVQHVKALTAIDAINGKKQINYYYDLISGNLNMVSYQPGKPDQFFYKYHFDADNRLVRALSSRDKLIWHEDASYYYYLHGPLARTELGQYKIQGIDHAYTLQGWLKGINNDGLDPGKDMAADGLSGTHFSRVSRDVFGLKLGYFAGDYKPVGEGNVQGVFNNVYQAPSQLASSGNQLFNGGITNAVLALSRINNGNAVGYSYGYDQLNRLVNMRQHTTGTQWSNSNMVSAYAESLSYDANGNILKYLRHGAGTAGMPVAMDSLTYGYNRFSNGKLINNRLNYVNDSVVSTDYSEDIDDESINNYLYDKIGNLAKDVGGGIDTINWNVYGKIHSVRKTNNDVLILSYDPNGNRTLKQSTSNGITNSIFYIRDAKGNVMAVYDYSSASTQLKWTEQQLYGSNRLGSWKWDTLVPAAAPVVQNGNPIHDSLLLGSKVYEVSNHLGNVLAVISDKKIGNDSNGVTNYYTAEVLVQQDYYTFGMVMPNRNYKARGSYRYGFNGKEDDKEVKGPGNQLDFGARIYDPRLGRFLSLDPYQSLTPGMSPYQFAINDPVNAIDLDGELFIYVTHKWYDSRGNLVRDETTLIEVKTFEEALTDIARTPVYVTVELKLDFFDVSDDGFRPAYGIKSVSDYTGGLDKLQASFENAPKWQVYIAKGVDGAADKLGINKIATASMGEDNKGNKVNNAFSRIMLAAEGLKDFYGVIKGGPTGNLKNLIADVGSDKVAEKLVDAAAKILKSYASNKIQESTIDVLANDIKMIIKLHKTDEVGAMLLLEALYTTLANYDQIIKIQDYINANKGSLPFGVAEAVDNAVLQFSQNNMETITVTASGKSKPQKE